MYTVNDLFDLDHTITKDYLSQFTYPWEALNGIKDVLLKIGETLSEEEYDHPSENVWISKEAKVYPQAIIDGACIIGKKTEVRPGAFIRGNAIIGENCVIGNSTELKNVIIFDNVQVPHYNYVGDSILGYKSHMGAGSITSNVKSDKKLITIKNGDEKILTGLKKIGAMLGDYVEVGCNSVLNPGTIVGRRTNIYPLSSVRGQIPSDSIFKSKEDIVIKDNKDKD